MVPVVGNAARDAAADDDARPRVGGPGDDVLVVALQRRIRDLEGVEDAHVDLLVERRQDRGHADEAHLALVAQREQLFQRAVGVELLAAQAAVELHEVEMVGLQQAQAVLDAVADVRGGVHVVRALGCAGHAAALRCERVLGATVGDELADELLAASVVDRRVDEVDAFVEHGVEELRGDGGGSAGEGVEKGSVVVGTRGDAREGEVRGGV